MEQQVRMKKEIGLLSSMCIMVGIMIGSGIFISPVSVVQRCGSIGLSLAVWALSGALVLSMALCYAELGTMFGTAGGAEYAYFRYTVGRWMAFLYAWFMFVAANPAFYALLALTTSNYIFQPIFSDCGAPQSAIKLFSIWITVSIVALNSLYVRYVTRAQTTLTAAKIIALLVIIATGIVQLCHGKTAVLETGFQNTSRDIGGIAIAFNSCIFSYGGWQYIFMLVEEVRDPQKNMPRATYISFTIVTAIYMLTNVAYFSVMTPTEMRESRVVAVDFMKMTLGGFSQIMPLFVACSTIGALNGSIFGGSRINYAAARDGSFPGLLAMISVRYLTPVPAVIVTCLLTSVYILTGEAVSLLEYLGFATCLMSATAIGLLLYLRWFEPDRKRPFKLNIVIPVGTFTVLTCLTLLGLYQDPGNNLLGVVICVTSLPVYGVFVGWQSKPTVYKEITENIYTFIQKLLLVVSKDANESTNVSSTSQS